MAGNAWRNRRKCPSMAANSQQQLAGNGENSEKAAASEKWPQRNGVGSGG
jgi:hypothetical protein